MSGSAGSVQALLIVWHDRNNLQRRIGTDVGAYAHVWFVHGHSMIYVRGVRNQRREKSEGVKSRGASKVELREKVLSERTYLGGWPAVQGPCGFDRSRGKTAATSGSVSAKTWGQTARSGLYMDLCKGLQKSEAREMQGR